MTSKLPYWKRRMLRIAQLRDAKDQEYINKMVKEYDRLSDKIYKEIQQWVDRYTDNEGIDSAAAYEQLSKKEQKTWSMTLKEFRRKAIEGGYDQELNREYFKSRINRLEQLERQLYFELAEEAKQQEENMSSYLKGTLNETYLRQIYELTDQGSFSIPFDRYSTKALELAIRKPWKGSNFSRRVWGNHLKHIPDMLHKTMTVAISQGWGIDRTVKQMMKGVDSSLKNRMTTLVQTESAHLVEVANDKSMSETGVEKWEWMATLEIHTCARCGGLDGQEFARDDPTAPNCPDHPNCRCTRVPVIAGWQSASRWQRDPVTGKGKIGPNVTFEEWKKAKVSPEVERELKIERAIPSDKKQFERYKSILGSDSLPKKFADFQDLKYNKGEEWTRTNLAYRDEILKKKIRNGTYNLTIHEGRQGKHILGHANYRSGKSYLLDVINPQDLVNKYAGTGEIQRRRGKWTNKELIIIDEFVGVNSNLDGTMPFTNRFQIHYSKAGVHIVPTLKGMKTSES